MVTLAKDGSLHARRQALGYIYDKQLVHALFEGVRLFLGGSRLREGASWRGRAAGIDAFSVRLLLRCVFQPLCPLPSFALWCPGCTVMRRLATATKTGQAVTRVSRAVSSGGVTTRRWARSSSSKAVLI